MDCTGKAARALPYNLTIGSKPMAAKNEQKRQALYVVNHLGRDQFIWASSAAEARERAEKPAAMQFVANLTAPGAATATAAFTGATGAARAITGASSRS
jgi:hypothetical protein